MKKRAKPKVDERDEAAEAALRNLVRANAVMSHAMQRFFGRHGISASQWNVLRVLEVAKRGGRKGLRMADIGERLIIRPPSVTGAVDRLERQGLVTRRVSAGDLRTKEVCLTAAGEGIVRRVLAKRHEHVRAVMGGMNAKENRELARLLERVIERLEGLMSKVKGERSKVKVKRPGP
jgi:DNA-binding MarR family transcriptional regulator